MKEKLDLFTPAKLASPRVNRAAKEVMRILSEIFQRREIPAVLDHDGKVVQFPGIITITDVKISPDLRECKVFISSLTNKNDEEVKSYFDKANHFIRKVFAQKSTMKFVPNFTFCLDERIEVADRIDKILKQVTKNPEGV
jgi:ribosome-binding factor A